MPTVISSTLPVSARAKNGSTKAMEAMLPNR